MSNDMDKESTQFPDYGDGGDLAGAKRLRHSFKLSVLAIVLLTIGMFVSEKRVRFGQTESLYISGITLETKASGRVLLLSAMKKDAQDNEKLNAKYTQALAVRQEEDLILRTYDEAQAIDDKNGLFTIRHGSRLFIMGYPEEALKKFERAEKLLESAQPNALPGYLQAAAIAQRRGDPATMNNAMKVVAKANGQGDIVFPKPLWFPAYPQTGMHYAQLQREIIDETCAPLYTLTAHATKAIEDKINRGLYDDARNWLGYLQQLADRLLRQSQPQGTIQAAEGIRIKIECNELLKKIELAQEGAVSEATIGAQIKLNQIRDQLIEYEHDREDRVQQEVLRTRRPNALAFATWFVFLGIWFLAWCLCRFTTVRHAAWSLRHNRFGKCLLIGGSISFFLLLC